VELLLFSERHTMPAMYEGGNSVVVYSPSGIDIGVMILHFVNLILTLAFIALLCYAGWKFFRWLRKWNP
jgi:hypothetical protein